MSDKAVFLSDGVLGKIGKASGTTEIRDAQSLLQRTMHRLDELEQQNQQLAAAFEKFASRVDQEFGLLHQHLT